MQMQIEYTKEAASLWEDIEEEEPDEIDIQMLESIRNNPDCHVFTNENDINWD